MFYRLSERIADGFEKQRVITSEDKEIYRYGVQQGLNLLLNLLTTIVIGVVCGMFWESVLFIAAYMPLRSFAGGFHAKTHTRCYLYSILMITAVLLVIKFFPLESFICGFISLLSGLFIFLTAPIENKNKKLDDLEICVYRKRTRIILICELLIQLFVSFSLSDSYSMCISLALLALSGVMLAGIIINKFED